MTDERLGETLHDPKKQHAVFAALVGWAGDNASLWNKAEAAERRRNSVVPREVQVAIPREVPPDLQIVLAVAFATLRRETQGVAVERSRQDVCNCASGGGLPSIRIPGLISRGDSVTSGPVARFQLLEQSRSPPGGPVGCGWPVGSVQ
ncbi:MAG: MobA/MobL family protein [Gemmatimonas sp.]|uniref:MobA/MobL family protein n=1 Tax=Gemmatimonas sp. TaxID=1962908 RepID=UPI00391F2030